MSKTQQHHYFASHALGWAVGDTQEDAIRSLGSAFATDLKPAIKNCHKAGEIGWYVWTCRVELPRDAHYHIEWFRPVDVEIGPGQEHWITHINSGKAGDQAEVIYYTAPRPKGIEFDARELGTVLAALRCYQRELDRPTNTGLDDIATDGGELEALTADEVDTLCEAINCG